MRSQRARSTRCWGPKASPQAIADWNRDHGYDRPLMTQFFSYLGKLTHLDFGYSFKAGQSVGDLFKENAGPQRLPVGGEPGAGSADRDPAGHRAGREAQQRRATTRVTALTFTLYSMPSFFLGLILIQVFALDLHIFPPSVSDAITTTWGAVTHPRQLALPIVTLTRGHGGVLQPVHALLGAGQPRPGLHHAWRAPRACRSGQVADAPPVPQLVPADDHA